MYVPTVGVKLHAGLDVVHVHLRHIAVQYVCLHVPQQCCARGLLSLP